MTLGPLDAPTRTAADPAVPATRPNPPPVDTGAEAVLRKVRWGVRGALAVGVAASVAANILHADPHPVSQVIAAWPPLALALTVELISRVPVHRRALAAVRLLATAAIAGIAAWVSYFHMAGVVSRYGETGTVPYLLPLSVDGLVIVASISLVELAGRIQDSERGAPDPLLSTGGTRRVDVPVESGHSASADRTGVIPVHEVDLERTTTSPPLDHAAVATVAPSHTERHDRHLAGSRPSVEPHHLADDAGNAADAPVPSEGLMDGVFSSVDGRPAARTEPLATEGADAAAVSDDVDEPPASSDGDRWTADEQHPDGQPSLQVVSDDVDNGDRADSTPEDDMPATAAAIAAWLRSDPTLQPADIAVKIDRSVRTVRRHWKLAVVQARSAASTPSTEPEQITRGQEAAPNVPGELRR